MAAGVSFMLDVQAWGQYLSSQLTSKQVQSVKLALY